MNQRNKLTAACAAVTLLLSGAILPATANAETAKEYAMDYCKRNEATKLDYDPKSDGTHETDRWYGQERNRFYSWEECVITKTKEFAVEKEPTKAEYNPTDKDRSYAKSYCSRSYKNPSTGTVWYGGAAEAAQPARTVTNSNLYLSQEKCEEAKTAESYYGATNIGDAPFTKQTNEDIAKMYCTEHKAVRHNKEVTVYGVGNTSYGTEAECMTDTMKWLDHESNYIAKIKAEGGIMQPWDGTQVQVSASPTDAAGQAPADLAGLIQQGKGNAINEDECAIWLCLPAGFPDGCGKAHSAMLKRLKKGRSALPDFASCAVGDADPNNPINHGFSDHEETVIKVGDTYQRGYTCQYGKADHGRYIPGCTGVYRKITVLQHGQPIGQTHYELIRANKPWEGEPLNQ